MPLRLAYVAPELGSLTSTFVYREIASLRARGHTVVAVSTRRPDADAVSEEARALTEETIYLYDCGLLCVASAVLASFASAPASFAFAVATALRDAAVARVPKPTDRMKLLWHFALGCLAAHRLRGSGIEHIHAHFAHVPASIAMYAARLLGVSFSFTAHANDIFERPTALAEKMRRAAFVASISEYNRRCLEQMGCDVSRVRIVRCGIDVEEFVLRSGLPQSSGDAPPLVLSVGRLVEKKGMRYLLEAIAALTRRGTAVRCSIVGGGTLYHDLQSQIETLGMSHRVALLGPLPQERVRELMEQASVFVLSCVVSETGDQDGIPVVLMEAMALGTPVVSTQVSGIPELVESGRNGLLMPPGDPDALAGAIGQALSDPEAAAGWALEARRTVEREFSSSVNTLRLEQAFLDAVASAGASDDN